MNARGPNYDDGPAVTSHLDCPKCGAPLEISAEDIDAQCLRNKTLRDEFAMAALTALPIEPTDDMEVAAFAYRIADAMMEARK